MRTGEVDMAISKLELDEKLKPLGLWWLGSFSEKELSEDEKKRCYEIWHTWADLSSQWTRHKHSDVIEGMLLRDIINKPELQFAEFVRAVSIQIIEHRQQACFDQAWLGWIFELAYLPKTPLFVGFRYISRFVSVLFKVALIFSFLSLLEEHQTLFAAVAGFAMLRFSVIPTYLNARKARTLVEKSFERLELAKAFYSEGQDAEAQSIVLDELCNGPLLFVSPVQTALCFSQ